TTTSSWPRSRSREIRSATWPILPGSATEVPPNFRTSRDISPSPANSNPRSRHPPRHLEDREFDVLARVLPDILQERLHQGVGPDQVGVERGILEEEPEVALAALDLPTHILHYAERPIGPFDHLPELHARREERRGEGVELHRGTGQIAHDLLEFAIGDRCLDLREGPVDRLGS